jgi:maltooligosyltrehalose trehalohydrolase
VPTFWEPRLGAVYLGGGRCRFRVWAPKRRRVELHVTQPRDRVVPMEPREGGYFEVTLDGVEPRTRYLYRLDGGSERPDPASRHQPTTVHEPSEVVDPAFHWADQSWRPPPLSEYAIYELHVGTFTREGTFDAAIPRLRELAELGVTAVELMPVAQFPGTRGWGYDGVYPFAPQNSYGGPAGLKRLVDACHASGLAVVLDVVYNHFGPEGNYLGEFGHYFTDRYRTPWGDAVNVDGRGSDEVRAFLTENALYWLHEYRVDALRLDAVHAIHDETAIPFLTELAEAVDRCSADLGRRAHLIAESDLNDVRVLRVPELGGLGMHAQWADDFHHAVHALLTGERHGYYADYGRAADLAAVLADPFLVAGTYSRSRERRHGMPSGGLPGDRFVVAIQNHDQVGNRARGDRFGTHLSPERQRLAASLLLLAPYVPLLFMGEEYGEERPFPFFCSFCGPELVEGVRKGRSEEFAAFQWQGDVPDPQAESTFESARLSWSWPEGSRHAGLRRLYADLLTARREWPPMRDFVTRSARLLPGDVLELTRGSGAALRAVFNLADRPAELPPIAGRVLFRSESPRYGSDRAAGDPQGRLLPFECVVSGPDGWRRFA